MKANTIMKNVKAAEEFISAAGIKLEDFYVVTIYPDQVKLQGHYMSALSAKCAKIGIRLSVDDTGYIAGRFDLVILAISEEEPEYTITLDVTLT